jgi:CelD/BcsL family acetyltransferase involved in cellulose biosynthesis
MQLRPSDLAAIEAVAPEWNRLAWQAGSPFLTYEWLSSWWTALGNGELLCAFLQADDGSLLGGACCRVASNGHLMAPTDPDYSEEWDVVALSDASRRRLWQAIAGFGARRLALFPLPDGASGADLAREELRRAGYRLVQRQVELSPYRPLPDSWDALMDSLSRNERRHWRRSRRSLDALGGLSLRVASSEDEVKRDLELFLRLEAAGWKGREGTAILRRPEAERLYRGFARGAARQGWLRIAVLESGGQPVAASYGCVFARRAFRIKSAFNEDYADQSPGFVLLGEELRHAVEQGLEEYAFLGAPTFHKLRWGARTRPRVVIRGYRGPRTWPAYAYRAKLRPLLGKLRRSVRG